MMFIDLIKCANAKAHHLKKSKSHPYQLRITLASCENRHFTGKRIVISLKTKIEKEAELRRDFMIDALSKGGFLTPETESRLD